MGLLSAISNEGQGEFFIEFVVLKIHRNYAIALYGISKDFISEL